MSAPKDGGLNTSPPAVAALMPTKEPCPAGPAVPREGSREIQKRGKVISVPWDWCKSKEKAVPYKIWCWQADAGNLANSVRQTDCRSHVVGSYVKVCQGDEPGQGGGIKSGTCQAECTLITGSSTVRAEGRPMGRRFDKWDMNHGNTWGCLENPEDTGNYNAPKVKLIKAQLNPPDPSREDDIQAAAQGTKVAQVVSPAAGPTVGPAGAAAAAAPLAANSARAFGQGVYGALPEKGDTLSDYGSRAVYNFNQILGKTKVDVGGKVQWVRITKQDPKCPLCKTVSGKLVESGTWAYSPLDVLPPDKQQHGIFGSHYNLWLADQIPSPNCLCQWRRMPFAAAPGRLPIDAIPYEPFLNTP